MYKWDEASNSCLYICILLIYLLLYVIFWYKIEVKNTLIKSTDVFKIHVWCLIVSPMCLVLVYFNAKYTFWYVYVR